MNLDPYNLLGVSRETPAAEVKERYRALALELHPDRNPALDAAERFAEVTVAYRYVYDEAVRREVTRQARAEVDRGPAASRVSKAPRRGSTPRRSAKRCARCKGSGVVVTGAGLRGIRTRCSDCKGKGMS